MTLNTNPVALAKDHAARVLRSGTFAAGLVVAVGLLLPGCGGGATEDAAPAAAEPGAAAEGSASDIVREDFESGSTGELEAGQDEEPAGETGPDGEDGAPDSD